ncbi:hypothetical protein [Achromobacter xylosoxidans]|uniref:hypothetical protein n=1 Tax=Alcaligenes xylosoxydans xylosoxydans TaxID=85698 RepID=UPI000B48F80C|nr:hypothetical protein [Achromobacter xylosoxidans]
MGLPAILIGWKGYAVALALGAALAVVGVIAWNTHGAAKFAAGREHEKLAAAANARQIEADYRRREQETTADYTRRLEAANDALRISNDERDRARADTGSLLDTIGAERAHAAKAAARAGVSEQSATRAWDVLAACTREYAAMAADADAAIDGLREGDAWAKAVAKTKP